jgi:hypothetical protein
MPNLTIGWLIGPSAIFSWNLSTRSGASDLGWTREGLAAARVVQ